MKHLILYVAATTLSLTASAQGVKLVKPIAHVRQVSVTAPEGTAPLLPYRLWTTYTDSTAEFRQVVWEGSDLATEEALARRKAGEKYTVKGRIAGDGQQVTANVTVAPPCPPEGGVAAHGGNISSPLGGTGGAVASPLPLDKVKLIGHNRLTEARDLDLKHLLSLDITQQLYNYRDTYGLPTEGYTESDGWDSPTTKLKGHGTGHYLSSLALAFASAPDAATRKTVLQRIRRMVNEMRSCQERTFVFDKTLGRYREARDLAPEAELATLGGTWADFDRYKRDYAHYGYGYLNAIPAQHCALIEAYRPYNNESGVWAPYYTVHKQLSGLIDIATLVTDKAVASKALLIAKDMGLWVWNRMHYRTHGGQDSNPAHSKFGDRSRMWNMYIAGEVGGMSESLARLSELCPKADDKARLLEAAKCFDSPKFFDPLTVGIDGIRGRHANQHIPMIVGSVEVYKAGGEQRYLDMAIAFWHHIQGRYRYAMGGVGNGEMFRQPYTQLLSLTTNGGADPEPTANETCCAYNLAKLSRSLNCFFPDNAALMDYHERLLYNQIIGSLRLSDYATTYQYAVGLDADKPWGNDTPQSTCCGGTGTENHLRYQEATYWTGGDTLWIAQYMPTEAQWGKTTVTQECEWPAESTSIIIGGKTRRFTLRLRVPYWATKEFTVKLNGETLISLSPLGGTGGAVPGTYCEIPCREWHAGDRVEITMPFTLHVDYTPDRLTAAALAKYSPFLQPKDKQPMWAGAVMLGPLVMTATDIRSWQDATLAADATASKLSSTAVVVNSPLRGDRGGLKLVADYLADTHTTHYLCFPGAADAVADSLTAARELATAKQRIAEQQEWEREASASRNRRGSVRRLPHGLLSPPWAPNGFRRLADAVAAHDTTAISVALATMRPGNLAEPEDLAPLLALISKAKDAPKAAEAVAYARMVVSYVRDGSGTHDMIEKAISKFKDVKM